MKNVSVSKLLTGAFCALVSSAALLAVEPAARTQALADARAGKNSSAVPVLEQLVAATPTDAEACVALANILVGDQKAKEAVALMEKAVAAEPNRADYQSRFGQILSIRIGQVSFMKQAMISGQMLDAFEKSVELDANHLPGYIGLCRYYANAPAIAGGSLEKAREYAAEVEKRDPVAGAIEYAMIAEKDSNWTEALARYGFAAKTVPNGAWFHERCGSMLVKLDRKDEARAAFQRSLDINPNFPPAKKGLSELGAK